MKGLMKFGMIGRQVTKPMQYLFHENKIITQFCRNETYAFMHTM